MTEKEIKRRLVITNILFWVGFLVCVCSIGHLDYLTEQRVAYGIDEFAIASAKGIVGLILMVAGMFVGRNLEFEDEESEVDEDVNE